MYEMKRTVTYSQVGSTLSMDMAGIVHFLQDCTLAHSESIGKGISHVKEHRKAWFLSSWQIEVERFPGYQENVTVRTWPYEFKSMYGYRNFDILDENANPIVRANSIWIFMDIERMLPIRPTEEDMRGYELYKAIEMKYAPRKIKQLDPEYRIAYCSDTDSVLPKIKVRRSFIDSNNNVNNGRYVMEGLDLIEQDDIRKLRVDYRKAAMLGDIIYPSIYKNEYVTQIVLNDADDNPYVLLEVEKE